jgi:hypothetical protein
MHYNVWPATAGQALLGVIFVFDFSSFTWLLLAFVQSLPGSVAGLLTAISINIFFIRQT